MIVKAKGLMDDILAERKWFKKYGTYEKLK